MDQQQKKLHEAYGPLVGGKDLRKLLGYRTANAFRQALIRGTLPIQAVRAPGRREWMARTSDVSAWLAQIDQQLEGTPAAAASKPLPAVNS